MPISQAEKFIHEANKVNSDLLNRCSTIYLTTHFRYVDDPVGLHNAAPASEVLYMTCEDGSSAYWSVAEKQWVLDPQQNLPLDAPTVPQGPSAPSGPHEIPDQAHLLAKMEELYQTRAKLLSTREALTKTQESNRCLANRIEFILDDLTDGQAQIKGLRAKCRQLEAGKPEGAKELTEKEKLDQETFEMNEMGSW